jgi:ribonuclease BN (tRNA processing enzyme)
MSGLRVLVLGVGNAFSALHYSSCLALEAQQSWLLIDCPHPIRKILREAALPAGLKLDVAQLAGVALTHLHADHASGLEGLGFYCRFVLERRMALLTHPLVSANLWEHNLAASMEWSTQEEGSAPVRRSLDEFFDLLPVTEARPRTFGPFTIHCRPTLHSIPTIALRIEAGGRSLGYSADTAFDPGLIDWLAPADLIIHESGEGGMHTPYAPLAALPAALRAKMRLIHCPDAFQADPAVLKSLRQGQVFAV